MQSSSHSFSCTRKMATLKIPDYGVLLGGVIIFEVLYIIMACIHTSALPVHTYHIGMQHA